MLLDYWVVFSNLGVQSASIAFLIPSVYTVAIALDSKLARHRTNVYKASQKQLNTKNQRQKIKDKKSKPNQNSNDGTRNTKKATGSPSGGGGGGEGV